MTEVLKVRKRPIDVEAAQFFPDSKRDGPLVNICECELPNEPVGARIANKWHVHTANGPVGIGPTTWIVQDPNTGDTWPVADAQFRSTYEAAPEKEKLLRYAHCYLDGILRMHDAMEHILVEQPGGYIVGVMVCSHHFADQETGGKVEPLELERTVKTPLRTPGLGFGIEIGG